MSLLFYCSECQRPLNIADGFAGKPGMCPACQSTIQVPETSEIQADQFRQLLERWKAAQQSSTIGSSDIGQSVTDAATDQVAASELPPGSLAAQTVGASTEPPKQVARSIGISTEALSVATGIKPATNPATKSLATIVVKPTSEVATIESGLWYVRPPAGGQFGPADATLFNKWVKEGRVTEDCYVWCKGWPDWKLASETVPAFSETEVSLEQNSDGAAAAAARTAYLQAKKRRTMRGIIAMTVGVVVVIALLIVLFFVIQR